MVRSKQTIPHFYLFTEVDMTWALEQLTDFNQISPDKVSINDLLIKASAETLGEFPRINSHIEEDRIIHKDEINIGVAVSVEGGLLVPVISNADNKNLTEIAAASRKISEEAQRGKLSEFLPATFTISNLGMYEVNKFLPIINPPECAIMGAGKIEKRIVPLDKNITAVREILTLSLACDHRGVDGVYAARFLEKMKKYLEQIQIGNAK